MTVLAVIEPNTLIGTELRQQLRGHRELWSEVRLLSAEADPGVATLSELDGAALVQPVSAERLDGVDLIFVCGDYPADGPPWAAAAAGTTTVLVSSTPPPAGAVEVVSGVNLAAAVPGGLLVSPHPAVVLLALLLHPLRALEPAACVAWLAQPATAAGRRGMDELMEQTRALLAFADERPVEVFGQQLAFNLLPSGQETAGIAAAVAALLGGAPTPAIEIVQAAVFHSFTASVLVSFADDPGGAAVAEALGAHPLIDALDGRDGRTAVPTAAAGSDQVLLGPITPAAGPPGSYWLRAVMDNLTRGGAANALEIAAAALGRTS